MRARPLVLCVIDGLVGRAPARTPELDALRSEGASTQLKASVPERGLVGNPVVDRCFRIAAYRGTRLHLIGVLSDEDDDLDAIFELIDLADFHEVPLVVHCVLGGRGRELRAAMGPIERLELQIEGRGAVGTLSGREYALAAEGRWDLVYRAYHAIVRDKTSGSEAPRMDSCFDAVHYACGVDLAEGWVPPIRIGDYAGVRGEFLCDFGAKSPVWEWTGGEVGLACRHHADDLGQLCALLARRGVPPEVAADLLMDRDKPILAFGEQCFATLTDDDPALAAAFSGSGADPLEPKTARAAAEAVASGEHDFVLVHLADPDEADDAVGEVGRAVRSREGTLLVTDRVELLCVGFGDPVRGLREGGSLGDLAPTVLELLGLEPPPEMTGRSLLRKHG